MSKHDPISSGLTHCDPPEPDCTFVKVLPTTKTINWEWWEDGAVVVCATHRLLAPGWAYEMDGVEEMEKRTAEEVRQQYEGDWPLTKQECTFNPGNSCDAVANAPGASGHCCYEYRGFRP